MFKQLIAGVGLAVMLASAAIAGPYEDGHADHERGDYETALILWKPLADQGDADAQFNLGLMYAHGHGLP